jgi:UDP-glucose 4-epimerase
MQIGTNRGASRFLVTGATGFIGSEIARLAVGQGLQVRGMTRRDAPLAPGVESCRLDLLDPEGLRGAAAGVSSIVHAAGLAHVFESRSDVRFDEVNVAGTANVVEAAAAAGVRQVVLVSSVSVYGPETGDLADESSPCRPAGAYAESKLAGERRAIEIARASGLALTILRLATVYGEGDRGNVARLIRAIDRGRFVAIGPGTNRKSLIHVEDVACACLLAAQQPAEGVRIYNVAAAPCTMREVVSAIARALGRRPPHWRLPAGPVLVGTGALARMIGGRGRLGGLHQTTRKWLASDVYDAGRFQRDFGFQPRFGLEEGIRREVAWYRAQTR